jgi:hypothetical protein
MAHQTPTNDPTNHRIVPDHARVAIPPKPNAVTDARPLKLLMW